jgi:hypothetical protein
MAPVRVMTIDSTVAKIGRSMKKRENKTDAPERLSDCPQDRRGGLVETAGSVRP